MPRPYFVDRKFENLQSAELPSQPGDYEDCIFSACDFSNSDLSDFVFIECTFQNCNLSLTKLVNTSFRETSFINSKLLGLRFDDCNKLIISFDFDRCHIELASFNQLKISRTRFKNSLIAEVDFTGTDLSHALFADCDLQRTVFHDTNLEGADLRTSFNYSIDPMNNRIKKARFSLMGIAGLLDRFDIEIDD